MCYRGFLYNSCFFLLQPPRSSHPVVRFSCVDCEPMVIDKLPFDKYELEPSPLTQYILERKSPHMCWQVGHLLYTTISSELYLACNLSQPADCRAEFHGGRYHGVKRAERNSGCLVFPYLLECIKHNTNYMSSPAFSNWLSSTVNEILLCRFSFKHCVVHYKSLGLVTFFFLN